MIRNNVIKKENNALVTIGMSYFGTKRYLKKAVESIVNQTDPRWRLIIANDGQDPATAWEPIAHIKDPRIIRYNFPENKGTFFCHSVMLAACNTEFYMPHDSDDWSEPNRLRDLLSGSGGAGFIAGPYIMHEPGRQTVHKPVLKGHDVDTYPWFTGWWNLWRTDFLRQIGINPKFRRAYDGILSGIASWTENAKVIPEASPIHYIRHPTSLTMSDETGDMSNYYNEHYNIMFSMWKKIFSGNVKSLDEISDILLESCDYKTWVDVQKQTDLMIEATRPKVTFGVATVSWRRKALRKTVKSLRSQGVKIRVYVNDGEPPTFLAEDEYVMAGEAEGDLNDVGKFYFLDKEDHTYYLSGDDDFIYPQGYVDKLINELNIRGGKAIVGFHASIIPEPYDNYSKHKIISYIDEVTTPIPAHSIGTGTGAYCPNTISLTRDVFYEKGNTDLCLAVWAQKNYVPCVSVPREGGWIVNLPESHDSRSLYKTEGRNRHEKYNRTLRTWKNWRTIPDPLTNRRRIIAGIATVEWRRNSLKKVVESLRPQVDSVRVYLNDGEVPDFLYEDEYIRASDADGDLKAMGKFYFIGKEPCDYYFSCDDDLNYPPNYVARMMTELDIRNGEALVGVFGNILMEPFNDYSNRENFHYRDTLEGARSVHILGTGTLAFSTAKVKVNRNIFLLPIHIDTQLGVWAQNQGIPQISIPRPEGWISDQPESLDRRSIWNQSSSEKHMLRNALISSYQNWRLMDDPIFRPAPFKFQQLNKREEPVEPVEPVESTTMDTERVKDHEPGEAKRQNPIVGISRMFSKK